MSDATLQLEGRSMGKSLLALGQETVGVVRVEDSRKEPMVIRLPESESSAIQRHLVRIECCAIGREDHDGLPNRIRDRAQIFLTLPQLLLRALAVIYVCEEEIPRGYV